MAHTPNTLLQQTAALRQAIRNKEHTGPTSGLATGAMQGNVVILPAEYANEFLMFCQKQPCALPFDRRVSGRRFPHANARRRHRHAS